METGAQWAKLVALATIALHFFTVGKPVVALGDFLTVQDSTFLGTRLGVRFRGSTVEKEPLTAHDQLALHRTSFKFKESQQVATGRTDSDSPHTASSYREGTKKKLLKSKENSVDSKIPEGLRHEVRGGKEESSSGRRPAGLPTAAFVHHPGIVNLAYVHHEDQTGTFSGRPRGLPRAAFLHHPGIVNLAYEHGDDEISGGRTPAGLPSAALVHYPGVVNLAYAQEDE